MFENWVCFGTYFLYVHTLNPFLEKLAFLSYPCAAIWAFILIKRRSFQLYFLRGGVLITPISSLLKTTSSIALHHQNERFRKKTLLLSNNADSAGNQYKLTRSSCLFTSIEIIRKVGYTISELLKKLTCRVLHV